MASVHQYLDRYQGIERQAAGQTTLRLWELRDALTRLKAEDPEFYLSYNDDMRDYHCPHCEASTRFGEAPEALVHRDICPVLALRVALTSLPTRPPRPLTVTPCGSIRFREAFVDANRQESLAGHIVLSVELFGHHEGLDMTGPVKSALDGLYLRKVDMADEILVLNVSGYVGESTRREIEYARQTGKPPRFLEPLLTELTSVEPVTHDTPASTGQPHPAALTRPVALPTRDLLGAVCGRRDAREHEQGCRGGLAPLCTHRPQHPRSPTRDTAIPGSRTGACGSRGRGEVA